MNVLNFFVLITAVVAALLFVNAGVLYVMSSANPGNIARAHKIFMTTLAGAVLVFAAWLLINTVMSSLVKGANFTNWNNLLCTENMAYTPPPATPPASTPEPLPTLPTGPATPFGTATETGARTIFSEAGITVNKSPPDTTVEGLQVTTVAGAIGLKDALGMPLKITGGTEDGHEPGEISHETGYKLDFGTNSNPALTVDKMKSVLDSGTVTRTNGEVGYFGYIEGKKVVAYLEDVGTEEEHWDVTFYKTP